MDRESKVEHGRPFGQLDQFACRGEDIDLVFVQVHLEILHQVERVVLFRFQGGTDGVQEFVQPAFPPFLLYISSERPVPVRRSHPCDGYGSALPPICSVVPSQ